MKRNLHWRVLLFFVLLSGIIFAQAGSYYDGISPANPSFINDLKNRIRSPYSVIEYAQFDETYVTNFASRDTLPSPKRVVTCVYSGENYVYTPPFAWNYFSREHTWCQSWMPYYNNNLELRPEYSDQHHLFPANQDKANGIRSNHPLGIVQSATYTYLEAKMGYNSYNRIVWEPRNSHKGDAARAILYMSVRYDGVSGNWTFNYLNNISLPKFNEGPQDLATLLQWNKMDPPDKWEIEKNNYIQSIQYNRNPFVDHPEWAECINFNDLTVLNPVLAAEPASLPADFKSVSTDSTVTLSWTGAQAGAQAPAGYLILAYSRDNYFIPVDGAVYSDDKILSDGVARVNITGAGSGNYTFSGLLPATSYYFTIYPYNGSGAQINYNTPGALVRTSVKTTGNAITSLHFESFSGSVFEDAGTFKLNVAIENPSPSSPTSVQVALISGNSQDLGNFAAQTLTFPAGSTLTQTVTLNLTDNNVIEGSRQAVLSLKNPSGGTYAKTAVPSDFTLTIQDNDGGAQGGLEDFASFPEKGQSYVSGTFTGKDKSVWTYKSCSGNSSVQIAAPSPVLQRNSTSGLAYIQSGLISGGCGVLSFKYMQAFSYNVNLGVYINDKLITTVTSSSETGKVKESGPVMVNTPGVFTIKLQQTDANSGQVTVDDVSWTNYNTSAVKDRRDVPLTFNLEQNYPNPFNPSTNITFSLSEKGRVRLSVFDLLGREVRCLVNEERGAGVYTESLDLNGFSNGIYVYRLSDGVRSVSKKMSLLK